MKPRGERILVIRYRFIGDTILTVPFLRNLRANYPEARIDVLVGPKSGEVLKGCPYVDELIAFDTTRFHKYDSGEGKPRNWFSYALDLRKRRYDLAFVLKRSFSSAALSLVCGAKRRVGYQGDGHFLLTDKVPFRTDIHEVDSVLSVLEGCGLTVGDRHLESFIADEELSAVLAIEPRLKEGRYVLIHAAAAHPDKTYPLESFAQLIELLHGDGFIPVFSGDKQDIGLYAQLAALLPKEIPYIDLSGKLQLRESMALYSLMKLAVCVDSGPSHLAASAGVPVVTLFGPTDPIRWGPYGGRAVFDAGLSCRPCHYKKTCDNRPCLTELSADLVYEACTAMLNGRDGA